MERFLNYNDKIKINMSLLNGVEHGIRKVEINYDRLIKKIDDPMSSLIKTPKDSKEAVILLYNIRKKLQKFNSRINSLNHRVLKLRNNKGIKKLIDVRLPKESSKFFSIIGAVSSHTEKIRDNLRVKNFGESEKNDIINRLKFIEKLIDEAKKLFNEIRSNMYPRKFKKKKAKNKFGVSGLTSDGISISAIVKVASGFDFNIRKGASHTLAIDLEDGKQPDALGKSTSFEKHIKGRMARSCKISSKELEVLVKIYS